MGANRWNLPDLGIGVGFRPAHFHHILASYPQVDWFEILSENFMDTGGRPLYVLDQLTERYPIVLHGVSMNIGSTDALDRAYLGKLKELASRTRAHWVSDHLCWTGVAHQNLHDLLPIPYNEETLRHTVARVRVVSDFLERPLVLENPSSYLEFTSSTMTEWEFFARLTVEADCGILLDVNNVYVSSFNHGFDPRVYIDSIPPESIVQYHLAGHESKATHIIDTHDGPVIDEVWELYGRSQLRTGNRATLLEWDADVPPFDVVHGEALKARRFRDTLAGSEAKLGSI